MATKKKAAGTTRRASAAKKGAAKSARKPAAKAPAKKGAAKKPSAKKSAAKPAPKKTAPQAALAPYRRKRDFTKTAEPSGAEKSAAASRSSGGAPRGRPLRYVIQKHAASHLHFDWRLELDGVMKSWAVPKGPSVVPGERRLAMEVEDHPISYNTFEGTIPKGQYGGGTVMLWDRGVYDSTDGGGAAALRQGYARGKLDITLAGERLKGSFTMVRTRGRGERAQWLLMKRTDEWADPDRDIVAEVVTSVDSGRTMEEIGKGKRVWQSNR